MTQEFLFPWLQLPMHVTSKFGPRRLNGIEQFHNGTDFSVEVGSPLYASYNDGLVKSVVDSHSGGKQLDVYYPKPGLCFKYLHLDNILVQEGQVVPVGKHLANTGNTGFSTGPHLHLSIVPAASMVLGFYGRMREPRKHYLDPEQFLGSFVDPATHAFLGPSERSGAENENE